MPKLNNSFRNSLVAVVSTLMYVELYSGSIPATGGTAPTGTHLCSWPGTLAWDGGVSGVNTLTGVPLASDNALATGTAGYARVWDGSTDSMYLTVGTSGAEMNLSSLSITSGAPVDITSATFTMPAT